jgi:peptide/nickel transport system permease protein
VPRALRRLLRNRPLAAGLLALGVLLALAWIVPSFRPDPNLADVDHGLSEMGAPLPPSLAAPLGTDDLGRDQLSRVSHAARSSLMTTGLATAMALIIGLLVGLTAGLVGGWLDAVLMRLVELALSFPVLLLAIFAAAALRAASLDEATAPLALVLSLFGWPATARVVRARARALTHAEFIVAARGLGASGWRVLTRHVLPNLAGVTAVMITGTAAQLLVAEATLSFAGLGAAPPEATWGRMIFEGRIYYRSAPWLLLAPGLALVVAVMIFHLLGAGLRRELEGTRS